MSSGENDVSYLGRTDHRLRGVPFGIRQRDRLSHTYLIGKTGVGKSSLLENLIRQDIREGRGYGLLDPHGDLAERVHRYAEVVTPSRSIYIDAADPVQTYGYNPLRRVTFEKIPVAAAGLLETFRKQWPDAWGVRMEHVLRNSLYALLEQPDATLPDILRLYVDEAFRKGIVRTVRNDVVRRFWTDEFEKYSDRQRAEAVAPIQNKLGAILTDPRLYRLLVAPTVDIRFRRLMDERKGLIVNLAKGRLGEDAANVLGGLITSTIGLAALSRADTPPATRRPFFLYVDEFASFTTLAFANMLVDLRKVATGLVLANQHLHQIEPDVRHAVLGNVGSLIVFRVGPEDAGLLARHIEPTFDIHDLLSLPNRSMYLKLMIDGAPSKPFSAVTADVN